MHRQLRALDYGGSDLEQDRAGPFPRLQRGQQGQVLRLLSMKAHPITNLRSKSWDEFGEQEGTAFNHVITVCNNAAGEACPVIPGQPAKVHWDIPDPAAVTGAPQDVEAAFRRAYDMLTERITAFVGRQ